MDNSLLIIVLALGTLGVVAVVGGWQLMKTRRSQQVRGETPGGIAGPSE